MTVHVLRVGCPADLILRRSRSVDKPTGPLSRPAKTTVDSTSDGMTEPSYRSDIRHKRVLVRVRRVAENRYRITDTKGRGLEYRKRQDFTADALSAIDAAESQEVWVAIPPSWSPNIVSFKTYTTGDAEGLALWDAVHDLANRS